MFNAKKVIAIALCLVMLFAFTACNAGTAQKNHNNSADNTTNNRNIINGVQPTLPNINDNTGTTPRIEPVNPDGTIIGNDRIPDRTIVGNDRINDNLR